MFHNADEIGFCVQEGHLEKIAKALDGPTLVRKGAVDGITNGTTTLHCDAAGSKRRAGGQVHSLTTLCFKASVVLSGWLHVNRKFCLNELHASSVLM